MPGKYASHHAKMVNRPGVNWVERAGGLPKPIDSVARALVAKGWTQQRAIATAVNHVKKTCATGRAFGGKTKVSAEAQGVACAAAAAWEALKAKAKSMANDPVEARVIELAFKRIEGEALHIDMAKAADKLTDQEREKVPTAYGTSFPIRNRADLAKAIQSIGRAPADKRETVRRFCLRRARELGAMDLIPADWKRTDNANVDMARGHQGLVQAKVKVRSRSGKVFTRTVWVRPHQAAALKKAGGKLSEQGAKVTGAQARVLSEMAKIPRGQRPKGWQDVVRALADPKHHGRLGPQARQALHELGRNASKDSPLHRAVYGALGADAPKKAKKRRVRRKRGRVGRKRVKGGATADKVAA